MNRFLFSVAASACIACASFGFASAGSMSSPMMTTSAKHMHSCPKGETWVHGYVRHGKKVHGYCRKG